MAGGDSWICAGLYSQRKDSGQKPSCRNLEVETGSQAGLGLATRIRVA
jgi:hypothetical protein